MEGKGMRLDHILSRTIHSIPALGVRSAMSLWHAAVVFIADVAVAASYPRVRHPASPSDLT
jgi:hypothetical protein